jgi:hypothetical protein
MVAADGKTHYYENYGKGYRLSEDADYKITLRDEGKTHAVVNVGKGNHYYYAPHKSGVCQYVSYDASDYYRHSQGDIRFGKNVETPFFDVTFRRGQVGVRVGDAGAFERLTAEGTNVGSTVYFYVAVPTIHRIPP